MLITQEPSIFLLRPLSLRFSWGSPWVKDQPSPLSNEVMTYSFCFPKCSCGNHQFLEQECWAGVWLDKGNPPSAIGPLSFWKITEVQYIKTIHKQKSIAQDSSSDHKVNKNDRENLLFSEMLLEHKMEWSSNMEICVEEHLKIEDKEEMRKPKSGRYCQGKKRNRILEITRKKLIPSSSLKYCISYFSVTFPCTSRVEQDKRATANSSVILARMWEMRRLQSYIKGCRISTFRQSNDDDVKNSNELILVALLRCVRHFLKYIMFINSFNFYNYSMG